MSLSRWMKKEAALWGCFAAGVGGGVAILVLAGRSPRLAAGLLIVYMGWLLVLARRITQRYETHEA